MRRSVGHGWSNGKVCSRGFNESTIRQCVGGSGAIGEQRSEGVILESSYGRAGKKQLKQGIGGLEWRGSKDGQNRRGTLGCGDG